ENSCPNTSPLVSAITARIPASLIGNPMEFLSLLQTITHSFLVLRCDIDFVGTPLAASIASARRNAPRSSSAGAKDSPKPISPVVLPIVKMPCLIRPSPQVQEKIQQRICRSCDRDAKIGRAHV